MRSFNFLSYATTPIIARTNAKSKEEATEIALQALWLSGLLGTLVALGLLFAHRWLLSMMGATTELYETAGPYLQIRALGAPAAMLSMVSNGIFRGLQDTYTPMVATVVQVSVRVSVLVVSYSLTSTQPMVAAALAVVLSEWLTSIWLVTELRRNHFKSRRLFVVPSHGLIWSLYLSSSWPLLVRTVALQCAFTYITAAAAALPPYLTAAHTAGVQLCGLVSLTVDALAVAAQSMMAKQLASTSVASRATALGIHRRLMQLGAALGLLLAVGIFAAARPLAQLFSDDEATVEATERSLWLIVAPLQLIAAPVYVLDGIFMGAGEFSYLALAMVGCASGTAAVVNLIVFPAHSLDAVWAGGFGSLSLFRLITLGSKSIVQ
jgi:putative MATE family efflux protein